MPHSGGGGSHGGGHHGGSHSHSTKSYRRSHHYFPGSRRYRKHYYDGRDDEYFYSDSRPQKTSMAAVVMMLIMAVFFGGFSVLSSTLGSPGKLKEKYTRPATRVIDNIGIIGDSSDLEDAFEEYNDKTGICPVLYTMYIEDYRGTYSDLESYAYDKYVELYSDEQHYLIVYAIPESQKDTYLSSSSYMPDYEYEVMIGNETDKLYSDNIFSKKAYDYLENGQRPEEAFENAIKDLQSYDAKRMGSRINLSSLVPVIFIAIFFGIPLLAALKNIKKEKEFEYEEVPLEDEAIRYNSTATYGSAGTAAPAVSEKSMLAVKVILIVFLLPFFLVGIGVLIGGIANLVTGNAEGAFLIFFGLFWLGILTAGVGLVFKNYKTTQAYRQSLQQTPSATNTRSDSGNYDSSSTGEYIPPQQDPRFDYEWMKHDDCEADHGDDDDSVMKGYE